MEVRQKCVVLPLHQVKISSPLSNIKPFCAQKYACFVINSLVQNTTASQLTFFCEAGCRKQWIHKVLQLKVKSCARSTSFSAGVFGQSAHSVLAMNHLQCTQSKATFRAHAYNVKEKRGATVPLILSKLCKPGTHYVHVTYMCVSVK